TAQRVSAGRGADGRHGNLLAARLFHSAFGSILDEEGKTMKSMVAMLAIVALAGCAGMRDKMPDWMPGSGAMKVSLSGAEEVPPAKSDGKGSGSVPVAEERTVTRAANP